jgi:hypothetical protein
VPLGTALRFSAARGEVVEKARREQLFHPFRQIALQKLFAVFAVEPFEEPLVVGRAHDAAERLAVHDGERREQVAEVEHVVRRDGVRHAHAGRMLFRSRPTNAVQFAATDWYSGPLGRLR